VLAATAGAASAQPAGAPDPATVELFVAKCASCHTVGKGNRVGPDLKGAVERRGRPWVERRRGAEHDARHRRQARDLLKCWRRADADLDHRRAGSAAAGLIPAAPGRVHLRVHPVTETTAGGPRADLHRRRFQRRVPCLPALPTAPGCASPGTFSKDLTHVYARLGDEGLDAALKAPAFRVMGKVFADRPLTAAEALALRAFLHDANRGGGVPTEALSLPLVAGLGALGALWALDALWARRLRGVRSTLVPRPRQEKAS
jgi:hypothetical protein